MVKNITLSFIVA